MKVEDLPAGQAFRTMSGRVGRLVQLYSGSALVEFDGGRRVVEFRRADESRARFVGRRVKRATVTRGMEVEPL